MIHNNKIIAFTPAGRERYMSILLQFMSLEHARGNVDQWVLFNNSYTQQDEEYVHSLARKFDWITIFEQEGARSPFHIHAFYKHFTERNAIYLRIDDDICYIGPNSIQRLINARIANKEAFLVYPTIIGNTRMAYWLQWRGILPEDVWGKLSNEILDPTAFQDPKYIQNIHRKALYDIEQRTIEESWRMPTRIISNEQGHLSSPQGHISVNVFAMMGDDMIDLKDLIIPDEERYLSQYRPAELDRRNMIVGGSVFIHFAYHTQTEVMEASGMLEDYKKIAMNLGI